MLAVLRGFLEGYLRISIEPLEETALEIVEELYLKGMSTNKKNISIISENGSAVQSIVTANNNYTISTKQLRAGVYFVRITDSEKTITLKFVKE